MLETPLDVMTGLLLLTSVFFFVAGTVGLLRFPDVYMRLHAVTKADNAGFGFLVVALSLQCEGPFEVALLVVIWLLVLAAGSAGAHLIARSAMREGVEPRR